MKWHRLLPAVAVLAAWTATGSAADLSKIDRTIAKEPSYRSKKPHYGLLVFGPAAKARVWVVRDGKDLYVDKNGNGDLTDPGEKCRPDGKSFQAFEINDRAGPNRYRVTGVHCYEVTPPAGEKAWEGGPMLHADVEIVGKFRQYAGGLMKERAGEAPVAHFHGPLKMGSRMGDNGPLDKLALGDSPKELGVLIGTMDKAHGCWVVINNMKDFPTDLHPVAEVEFPPKRPGEKPIVRRYELKQRC